MSSRTDRNMNAFLNAVKDHLGKVPENMDRPTVVEIVEKYDLKWPVWLTNDSTRKVGRGLYSLENTVVDIEVDKTPVVTKVVAQSENETVLAMRGPTVVDLPNSNTDTLIPEKISGYVPFGNFNDVRSIVKSAKFYPMYITGLSGNGKTMMVEQVCAQEKRECIRVNITIETDEDDLIGGFRLVNGQTVWHNGPVIHAMERGAVLLLDEVDLGSNKMMCLQPVLEGKSIFLKKINKTIFPKKGFNIIATANTKGKGSDDGRFIGTNVMNEAFLERFSVTFEQSYPSEKTELKILDNVLKSSDMTDPDFLKKIVDWANIIRKSFFDGSVSEIISTRRLVHICEAYVIFGGNRQKALQLCLNRFDPDTKNSFMDFYSKIDANIDPTAKKEEEKIDEDKVVEF